jgi:DNA (cytosine-5)-methyltransferase 1
VKPVLLDLFCGAGGAAMGYQRAGFHVIGVDIRPQPTYPGDEFYQQDVVSMATAKLIDSARFVHASPPCQGYSPHVSSQGSQWAGTRGKDEPRLIAGVRAMLRDAGRPYIIENVVGARRELRGPLLLCGTMFNLPIPRHRLFESPLLSAWDAPRHPACGGVAGRYATARGWDPRDMTVTGKGRRAGTKERWAIVMGWPEYTGTQHGLREAIPPAYTEWIGRQLILGLEAAA